MYLAALVRSGRLPQAALKDANALPPELYYNMLWLSLREVRPRSVFTEPHTFGSTLIRSRTKLVAEYCADHFKGDFVEIGCLHGATTRILAGVARHHGRRVIAVDPWCSENRTEQDYQEFLKNTKEFGDIIDIVRESSLSDAAKKYMAGRDLCMAYVDGLHTYEAALSDILAVAHCNGIISVDDVSYGTQVMCAMRRAALMIDRVAVRLFESREGYLVRRERGI